MFVFVVSFAVNPNMRHEQAVLARHDFTNTYNIFIYCSYVYVFLLQRMHGDMLSGVGRSQIAQRHSLAQLRQRVHSDTGRGTFTLHESQQFRAT